MTKLISQDEIEKKTLLILRILKEVREPLGSRLIARRMTETGMTLSERAVRYHLRLLDERGLTRLVDRRDGREITDLGEEELSRARVQDKVGLAISRIENLSFETTFNPGAGGGNLPMNVSFFPERSFKRALAAMKPIFKAGLSVSDLVAVAYEGDYLGNLVVPRGQVGFATVCSIVVNGFLLKRGVPMDSKFGGILEMDQGRPVRFIELIHYSGSSLDPSEVFIMGKMTAVSRTVQTGKGLILANFREIPGASRPLVEELIRELKASGIGGVLALGGVGEHLCQIPLEINKVGIILLGGLNPVAGAYEAGIGVENRAMSTVIDYRRLRNFWEILRET